jgi:hypothetical protein
MHDLLAAEKEEGRASSTFSFHREGACPVNLSRREGGGGRFLLLLLHLEAVRLVRFRQR